jgi:hypothetical protein
VIDKREAGPLGRRNNHLSQNLQIGDGSLIITGLFGSVKRFCTSVQYMTSIYDGFVRDCLGANAISKGEA